MAYLGQDIKKLGFGLMRLPMLNGEIDIEQVKQMVDLFMAKGFSYFDTAYVYHDGKSEVAAKIALVDRYPRERFQLATKLAAWYGATNPKQAQDMFWTSLERTGAGYFDYYLLHNLGDKRTEVFDRFGVWDFLAQQKKAGRIRNVGFSFHDKAQALDDILKRHPETDFVQLQINYADWDSPVVEARKCYEVARAHNKPIVVMEPVRGGSLAMLPPAPADLFKAANPQASQASWAIRYAASLDGLVTVLSGMSSLEQMRDNLTVMEHFRPLDATERAVVETVRTKLAELPHIDCTDCRYCLGHCPEGVRIPGIFSAMNTYLMYNNLANAQANYGWTTGEGGKASACVACGKCEDACPQHLPIINDLQRAAAVLEAK